MKLTGHILVLGPSSGIGQALCRELASRGCRLLLAGRDGETLLRMADDLAIRYRIRAEAIAFDASDFARFSDFARQALAALDGRIDGVLLCYGSMPEQQAMIDHPALLRAMVDVNYTSPVVLLNELSAHLQKGGWVCALSSVAGDRGRLGNYLYGSTKAALSTYLSGLRVALHRRGIAVITVKPGPVDTAMTWGLGKLPLLAPPQRVARDIAEAIRLRRDVVYTPAPWRIIMAIIRAIPEWLFKRLSV